MRPVELELNMSARVDITGAESRRRIRAYQDESNRLRALVETMPPMAARMTWTSIGILEVRIQCERLALGKIAEFMREERRLRGIQT